MCESSGGQGWLLAAVGKGDQGRVRIMEVLEERECMRQVFPVGKLANCGGQAVFSQGSCFPHLTSQVPTIIWAPSVASPRLSKEIDLISQRGRRPSIVSNVRWPLIIHSQIGHAANRCNAYVQYDHVRTPIKTLAAHVSTCT